MMYGGSSSDLLAFKNSDFNKQLDNGILALDLVIFGNNAYLNTPYMVILYPDCRTGPRDNYTF